MREIIVRYRVKPDRVAENEALVRAVYAELADTAPAGINYATFKEDDGVTFVHVALQSGDGPSPLSAIAAFRAFQDGIRDRCDEPPVSSDVERVGSYRIGDDLYK